MPEDPLDARGVDVVLHELGPVGKYACLHCFLYYCAYLVDAHHLFSFVFTGQDVEHKCAAPTNESAAIISDLTGNWTNSTAVHYGKCSIVVTTNMSGDVTSKDFPCLYGMEYAASKDLSLVSDFDLVCERASLAGLTQTLLMLGGGLGGFLFPWLSDRFGRKRTVVVSEFALAAASLMTALAPTYSVMAASKFCTGVMIPGTALIAVTAGVELFPKSHRAITSGFFSTFIWAVCIALLAPLAYACRLQPWRTLQIVITANSAIAIVKLLYVIRRH